MADWSDFETLRNQIKYNTVDRLKHIVTGLNEQCGTHITKGGKKQDLIDRITDKMDSWRQANALDKWARLKPILMQVRESGHYYREGSGAPYTPTTASYPSRPQSLNSYASSSVIPKTSPHYEAYSTSNLHRSAAVYDPYAPPRKIISQSNHQSSAKISAIRFKPSPFFKVETQISSVVECPESTGSMDRRSQSLTFSISHDVLQKLRSERDNYQLRLYCTSSTFYNHNPHIFRWQTSPCPIEFPPTCEVRVNTCPITANLKGMKKKPGTAPPAELPMKSLHLDHVGSNQRIDMIYVNSQQPVQVKKYYMAVFLVEVTTAEQLVERLRNGKRQSEEEGRRQMAALTSEDDDIIIGEVKLSLKCPLTYTRIKTPCRSSQCTHPQCFDALSWYQLMEQTTTWLCPVCEKVISPEDVILDGFFESILWQITDEDIENILMEPNGEWHTADNKYGSPGWLRQRPKQQRPSTSPERKASIAHINRDANPSTGMGQLTDVKYQPPYVVSLCESDEEAESMITRDLSRVSSPRRSSPSTGVTSTAPGPSVVIDLTLDSDEEMAVPRAGPSSTVAIDISQQAGQKRKRSSHDSDGLSQDQRYQGHVLTAPTGPRAPRENDIGYYEESRYDQRADSERHPSNANYLQPAQQQQMNLLPQTSHYSPQYSPVMGMASNYLTAGGDRSAPMQERPTLSIGALLSPR